MKSTDTEVLTDGYVDALSKARIYRDYQRAFTDATQLPIDLHEPHMNRLVCFPQDQTNPFCALVAKTIPSCAACYELQQQLAHDAERGPTTLKCFAGLCESAVPVRVSANVIAFLHTGQIFLHEPTEGQFNRAARALIQWGANVDLKQLEEAYFHTRVVSPTQYEALLRLLAIFAEHLAACSTQLLFRPREVEPESVQLARAYIAEHRVEQLSLGRVARAVNLSATYFSELFKKSTGMNFVEYVAKVRVEKAKDLLQNPGLAITQIALEVGFQSLSQFNRSFKKSTGQSPRAYRHQLIAGRAPEPG